MSVPNEYIEECVERNGSIETYLYVTYFFIPIHNSWSEDRSPLQYVKDELVMMLLWIPFILNFKNLYSLSLSLSEMSDAGCQKKDIDPENELWDSIDNMDCDVKLFFGDIVHFFFDFLDIALSNVLISWLVFVFFSIVVYSQCWLGRISFFYIRQTHTQEMLIQHTKHAYTQNNRKKYTLEKRED